MNRPSAPSPLSIAALGFCTLCVLAWTAAGCSSGASRTPAANGGSGGDGEETGGSGGNVAGTGGAGQKLDAAPSGGSSGSGGASSQDASVDASITAEAGRSDGPGGAGDAGGADAAFSSDAGYGCGDVPGFCDNGIRTRPPTGNADIDGLLNLTPEACAKKVSKHAYKMDLDKQDPDNLAGLKADICGLNGAVYWVADMDIDCDGRPTPGKCDKQHDLYYMADTLVHGPKGALAAAEDPYVVIPIDFACPLPGFGVYPGLNPGTTVAVIFGIKIFYGVFGDCGPPEIIGEASYAMAEKLGIPPSAVNGGALGQSVTYVVFTGDGTVAKDISNQAEVKALGEALTKKLLMNNK
jgi:hypothetical protein